MVVLSPLQPIGEWFGPDKMAAAARPKKESMKAAGNGRWEKVGRALRPIERGDEKQHADWLSGFPFLV